MFMFLGDEILIAFCGGGLRHACPLKVWRVLCWVGILTLSFKVSLCLCEPMITRGNWSGSDPTFIISVFVFKLIMFNPVRFIYNRAIHL